MSATGAEEQAEGHNGGTKHTALQRSPENGGERTSTGGSRMTGGLR